MEIDTSTLIVRRTIRDALRFGPRRRGYKTRVFLFAPWLALAHRDDRSLRTADWLSWFGSLGAEYGVSTAYRRRSA